MTDIKEKEKDKEQKAEDININYDRDNECHDIEDWYLEQEVVMNGGIENQSAGTGILSEDPRIKFEQISEDLRSNVGQVMCRFTDGQGKKVTGGSGTLIKKLEEGSWLMLTAASVFKQKKLPLFGNPQFYLQRNGLTQYACKFEIDANSIKNFTKYQGKSEDQDQGYDFALAKVTILDKKQEFSTEFQELKAQEVDDETNVHLLGYPNQVYNDESKVVDKLSNYFLYSNECEGQELVDKDDGCIATSLMNFASKGQEGGPLMTDDGTLVGVYSCAYTYTNEDGEQQTCFAGSILTQSVVDWINAFQ